MSAHTCQTVSQLSEGGRQPHGPGGGRRPRVPQLGPRRGEARPREEEGLRQAGPQARGPPGAHLLLRGEFRVRPGGESPRQDRTAVLGGIPPIIRSFSANFPPKMVPHPCYIYISGISAEFGRKTYGMVPHLPIAHMFMDSAYFLPMF